MRQIYLLIVPFFFLLQSCEGLQVVDDQELATNHILHSAENVRGQSSTTKTDEALIGVPLQKHILTLHRDKYDVMSVNLSSEHKISVQNWWDSLPGPIRRQVLSSEIDIELISEVVSTESKPIDPIIADSQVETTGDYLEEVMGTNADITYIVNTRFIDTQSVDIASSQTNIRLIKSVPIKLDIYRTQFTMRNEQFDNDNARSLQYWWVQLPDELKEQVQSNSINIVATYHQSTKLDDIQTVGMDKAMDNLSSMNEALAKIIGIRRINGSEIPFNFITPPTVPSPLATQSHIELKLVRHTPSIPIL